MRGDKDAEGEIHRCHPRHVIPLGLNSLCQGNPLLFSHRFDRLLSPLSSIISLDPTELLSFAVGADVLRGRLYQYQPTGRFTSS